MSACLLHQSGVFDPAGLRGPVQAGDDRNGKRGAGRTDQIKIGVRINPVRSSRRLWKVVGRFGRIIGGTVRQTLVDRGLGLDLFLKKGWQNHGGRAGIFQPAQMVELRVNRRSGSDQGVLQRKTKIMRCKRHTTSLRVLQSGRPDRVRLHADGVLPSGATVTELLKRPPSRVARSSYCRYFSVMPLARRRAGSLPRLAVTAPATGSAARYRRSP